MAPRRIVFSREDLAQLPEDCRAELIEGDLVMVPAPDGSHQLLLMRVARAFQDALGPTGTDRVLVAPCDVVFDDHNVLQPDVLVLPEGTKATLHPWKIPQPDVVVEVLSPSSVDRDRGVKLRVYARFGIEEAWIVDQFERTVEVHDLTAGRREVHTPGETAVSMALPELRLDVDRLFSIR